MRIRRPKRSSSKAAAWRSTRAGIFSAMTTEMVNGGRGMMRVGRESVGGRRKGAEA